MPVKDNLEHFFKPEVRKQGRDLLAKDLVVISHGSDTAIQAYVRASTSVRVKFSTVSIESKNFVVACSCPSFSKGTFCKHIWATLIASQQKYPDFFDSKKTIEKADRQNVPSSSYKEKQAKFQHDQYERQKQHAKNIKLAKKENQKALKNKVLFSEEVERALFFFAENGFPMVDAFNEEYFKNAKKKLSRVFHPDKGGTHQESLTLNQHFNVLMEYFKS